MATAETGRTEGFLKINHVTKHVVSVKTPGHQMTIMDTKLIKMKHIQ